MHKILVTGAAGQIGSELVPARRAQYGADNVIAAGHHTPLPHEVRDGGPCITLDVTNSVQVESALRAHEVGVLYHLSSILSARAEADRPRAHAVNINVCGSDFLQRPEAAALYLLPASRHPVAYDVHAGLHQGYHRSGGGRRIAAAPPRRLQCGRYQFHPG